MRKKKAGKLQTGSTFPKQYWLAVNGKPKNIKQIKILGYLTDSYWKLSSHEIPG